MPTLRLLTYNVRSLRDDPQAVARIIGAADPHIVCVQEAPRFLRWRSRCAELARRSSLVVVTGGRPAAANLILSSLAVEIVSTADVLLSPVPGMHRRGMALAQCRLAGRDFAIASTHLDLSQQARLRHVGELEQVVRDRCAPEVAVVVAGDINDDPGSPTWSALLHGRVDAWASANADHSGTADLSSTEVDGSSMDEARAEEVPGATSGPADHPRRRIDAIFVPPSLRVRSCRVITGAEVELASDHRPVLAEIEL